MAWSRVKGQRAVMLSTFRRNGTAVATPVGYGIDGDNLYFMTSPDSGKVKRIARNPHVEVAASTLRGQVRGPGVTGTATEITGPQADRARFVITRHNRIAWFFLLRKARREDRAWRYYAVTEADLSTTSESSKESA